MIALSAERIASLFRVDVDAGRVFWVNPPKNHPRMEGKEAGHARPGRGGKAYCVIHVNKQSIRRGHLVFFSVFGRWPTPCLDHINGDSLDDRITNLREVTVQQNAWNHKGRRKASGLPMGVRKVGNRFDARLAVNGKSTHLGMFDTAEAARTAYLAKRKEFFGEYA